MIIYTYAHKYATKKYNHMPKQYKKYNLTEIILVV